MQIIKKDIRKGFAKIKIESKDDIWYLSTLIDINDVVSSQTTRKVKLDSGGEDRKAKVSIRKVTLSLITEKIEFHKYTGDLRISGKIKEGKEDIPAGSYHTFNIEENTIISIQKNQWLNFQVKRLEEAAENKPTKILVCIFDRDEALFALMKKYGYDILSEIKGNVQKKAMDEKITGNFYQEIIKMLKSLDDKHKLSKIIAASPGFWKEELNKELKDETLKKKILFATSSGANKSALNEVLKRPEVVSALKQDRIVKEVNLISEVLGEIKKSGVVAYGIKETKEASKMGAIKSLLVSDELIVKKREEGKFEEIEKIMKNTDGAQGEVHIISSDHEGGKTLNGLGGIAGLLRYKIN
ncbi:mRNA surveillance protein pelota [Candidatus Woesearchaeota archaeon]|jgi:protein pelota|nr:mRNA surveillance protein pelota [Candidatus Woesearchaeota archaeon]MBT5273045.1 mRNA surveillance protein pelota [Candidatus Woesearchaeota archaeon]MBT6040819.1 mRNA surveillance protein pelota [Candidatus Woesearchaeota archaeon]MBT6337640.1 mRNA surveillance protein pelota [Candidatus Woesearchaeota archaeon]MBT7926959.1 mRNA surveillance protein pelota [Candidatus Woesearchaeota archaeon]